MESFRKTLFLFVLCSLPSKINAILQSPPSPFPCQRFSPIYAFGDSITDTGNQVRAFPALTMAWRPPYGQTYFGRPTGRYSDGRLMLDFLTTALNEGLIPPHFAHPAPDGSENFAVGGATALDTQNLSTIANVTAPTSIYLDLQISYFNGDTSCAKLSDALVYFGMIGVNDYVLTFLAQRPASVVERLINPVARTISTALSNIISHGVKHIVVQGQFPIGCVYVLTNALRGSKTDRNGCIESANLISHEHNRRLKNAVSAIARKHTDVNIVFFDTSAAYFHILENAQLFGFSKLHEPCYTGILHLFAGVSFNASLGAEACSNPQNYVSWDGIHLTDGMYHALMKLFLTDPRFVSPSSNFLSSCTHI
ncbi:hypothetical protein KP509_04G085800 [Ceratopteris richardii]|uniref:GDSL esterase/lipase n=1 Tax=Ceratopteris richardii TaxID=49495 RepID=A0A8T2UUT6_CERRI|nr:hypothetical protein KP509_04G085800 [Ceratopteris richardii]